MAEKSKGPVFKIIIIMLCAGLAYCMNIVSEILTIETDQGIKYQVELYLKQKKRGTFKQRFFIGCGLHEQIIMTRQS